MAKPNNFRLDLVNNTVRIILLALQAAHDHGAGVDELLLIQARLNHRINTELLLSHLIDITTPPEGGGETH